MNVFLSKTDSHFRELVGDLGSDVQESGASAPELEANGAVI